MHADVFLRRELNLFSSRGTRDFSAAFSALAGPKASLILISLSSRGTEAWGIRLQILPRLDCQLAEKIRFIGIVGNLDDPCFYVFSDSLIESSARRLLIENEGALATVRNT